jgi:hypothetical protein
MPTKYWSDMGIRLSGNGTSVLTDISSSVNSQSLSAAITDLETTGMGATVRTRINGLADQSIDLNGFTNSTTDGIFGPLLKGTAKVKRIEFKAYSGRYYNGSVLPTKLKFSGAPDTAETWSCTFVFSSIYNRTSIALT